ncbi:MAG: class I tRNA ligase family protein, partial [Clostridia bacterium]|nr:class I tRNA ligase family protein [Clostridia bacterium]
EDLRDHFAFNTAISAIMELTNAISRYREQVPAPQRHRPLLRQAVETVVQLLAPMAPHLAEECWERLGHQGSVHAEPWPVHDPAALQAERVTLAVQVNGKVRSRIEVEAGVPRETIEALALADERVQQHLRGRAVRQVIIVPERLVNIVVT